MLPLRCTLLSSVRLIGKSRSYCSIPNPSIISRPSFKRVQRENAHFRDLFFNDLQMKKLHIIKSRNRTNDENVKLINDIVVKAKSENLELLNYYKEFTQKVQVEDEDSLICVLEQLKDFEFEKLKRFCFFLDDKLSNCLANGTASFTKERFEKFFQVVLILNNFNLNKSLKTIGQLVLKSFENFNIFDNDKENMLKFLFLINLSRKPLTNENSMLIELQAMKFIFYDQFNLKEIALTCLAFHKTKCKFQTSLIEHIIKKLISNIDELNLVEDEITLTAIIKSISNSSYEFESDLLNKLSDKLLNGKFRNNFSVLNRFLAVQKRHKKFDEKLVSTLINYVNNNDNQNFRVKDFTRLLSNLQFLNVQLTNEQIEKFKDKFYLLRSDYDNYPIEHLLVVFVFAGQGHLMKEDIFTLFRPDKIERLREKEFNVGDVAMHLNNIIKLFGDEQYKKVTLSDSQILRLFSHCSKIMGRNELYESYKKFKHFSFKLYSTYQMLRRALEGRVYLCHILPGSRYPQLVITPFKTFLKDYPFPIRPNVAKGFSIVRIEGPDVYCDLASRKVTGRFILENKQLEAMGFRLFRLEEHLMIRDKFNPYLQQKVLDELK